MDENFKTDSGVRIEASFFEYTERSSVVKPSANPTKAIALISIDKSQLISERSTLVRESNGARYFVKEISNSGIGILELSLEKQGSHEAITHGKF